MKKIVSLILAFVVVLLCFTSCTNKTDNSQESNTKFQDVVTLPPKEQIALTLDNYKDYLEIDGTTKANHTESWLTNPKKASSKITTYKGVDCNVSIKGNSHYEYTDVYVDVKFTHYTVLQWIDKTEGSDVSPFSEKIVTIKLNLAGNGDGECFLNTPGSDYEKYENCTVIDAMSYQDIEAIHEYTYYDVVGVRGSVAKY